MFSQGLVMAEKFRLWELCTALFQAQTEVKQAQQG